MVTRMQLGDYTLWVTVEGKEVEHYSIEGDETKKEVYMLDSLNRGQGSYYEYFIGKKIDCHYPSLSCDCKRKRVTLDLLAPFALLSMGTE